MEGSAYLLQLIAGVFYTAAAIPLLRLSARTHKQPEWLLGWAFVCFGLSYFSYQSPMLFASDALMAPLSFLGRAFTALGFVALALFTRLVFRPEAAWARRLAWACGLMMATGIGASVARGDWEGFSPLGNPFFWLEWTGGTAPTVWVMVEGFLHAHSAAKRVRFGLSNAVVANRFFIWGMYGLANVGAMAVMIPMCIEYERTGAFSAWSDAAMAAFEMLAIGMVWLAFFPPRIYRSWIAGRAGHATGGVQAS